MVTVATAAQEEKKAVGGTSDALFKTGSPYRTTAEPILRDGSWGRKPSMTTPFFRSLLNVGRRKVWPCQGRAPVWPSGAFCLESLRFFAALAFKGMRRPASQCPPPTPSVNHQETHLEYYRTVMLLFVFPK